MIETLLIDPILNITINSNYYATNKHNFFSITITYTNNICRRNFILRDKFERYKLSIKECKKRRINFSRLIKYFGLLAGPRKMGPMRRMPMVRSPLPEARMALPPPRLRMPPPPMFRPPGPPMHDNMMRPWMPAPPMRPGMMPPRGMFGPRGPGGRPPIGFRPMGPRPPMGPVMRPRGMMPARAPPYMRPRFPSHMHNGHKIKSANNKKNKLEVI